jgi:hypothetical protein
VEGPNTNQHTVSAKNEWSSGLSEKQERPSSDDCIMRESISVRLLYHLDLFMCQVKTEKVMVQNSEGFSLCDRLRFAFNRDK